MRIVIIGGDAAGMSAASQIKRQAPQTEVVVLEQGQDVSYGACGLPYMLPDGRDVEDLKVITVERFRSERQIDVRLGHRALRIDPQAHEVHGEQVAVDASAAPSSFAFGYDKLIIATGARVRRPPIPGLTELWGQGAYPLKTLEDGRRLKAALGTSAGRRPRSAAIIGGGYIGPETAENLRHLGLTVTVVKASAELLPWMPDELRQRVYAEAEAHGVELLRGVHVERIARSGSGELTIDTRGRQTSGPHGSAGAAPASGAPAGPVARRTLKVDIAVVTKGVLPNAELAAEAGLALGAAGSIAVDTTLATSHPDIFAAGDCADAIHGLTGASTWIPLALRANRAGKLAGQNALGNTAHAPPVMGTAVFRFFGLEIARSGLSPQQAQQASLETVSAAIEARTRARYYPGGGKLSVWLLAERGSGRLLGGMMVGPEWAASKIDTVAAALHGGMTVEQVYGMDLAYSPPFGPTWSPLLTCASALQKRLRSG